MTEQAHASSVDAFLQSVASAGEITDRLPLSLKIRREAEAQRQREVEAAKAFEAQLNGPDTPDELIGKMIPGMGIYMGRYEPGGSVAGLGVLFNAFAAPQDLTDDKGNKEIYSYEDTVKRVAALQNWHGFDGTPYKNETEMMEALEDRRYTGGWIIPPIDLLDTLQTLRKEGEFKKTLVVTNMSDDANNDPSWYWSSTPHEEQTACIKTEQFKYGLIDRNRRSVRHSVRPVRLVKVQGV
jgi:hypothetical protein